MNRKVLLVGSALVVPLLAFLAISFRFNPNVIESPLLGHKAPDFSLRSLDGSVVRLNDLQGRPVVINFWATWCQPCMAEHGTLLQSTQRYGDDVVFLGVIYQDDPEKIRRFVERRGAWGPSLIDESSRVAIAFGVYGVPETFVIDPQGVVAEKITGAVTHRRLDSLLKGMI